MKDYGNGNSTGLDQTAAGKIFTGITREDLSMNPAALAVPEILAPHALTTHFKNYRVVRTDEGLALENCALGDGDIDLPAIAETLAKHNPQINLNIEIHSQFAPFKLDILRPAYWARHPSPPGDGLAWYLAQSWPRAISKPWPQDLPDGNESWQREASDLRRSIQWTKDRLSRLWKNP